MIQTIADFLPEEMLATIIANINNAGWKYGWKSSNSVNYSHWNQTFAENKIAQDNGLDISNLLPNETMLQAWNHIKENHFPDHILLRCYANAHTYGVEGYPHFDSRRKQDITVVIYLNKNWNRAWGGETAVYNGNEIIHSSMPVYNKATVFSGSMIHSAKSVSRVCPELRMTLMFKIAPKDSDLDRDTAQNFLMELDAHNTAHGKRNLARHCLSVYDLLKLANQDRDTCLAAAFHSIFGTNTYKNIKLTLDQKNRLIQVIGIDAADIAELFCILNRPNVLEAAIGTNNFTLKTNDNIDITVTEKQFSSLCMIEAANLYDQAFLDKRYPKLKSLWDSAYQ